MIRAIHRQSEEGSVMVEFAFVSLMLFLLLVGIIQIGLVFNTQLVLQEAARNAARSAAISTLPDDLIINNIIKAVPSVPLSVSNIVIAPTQRIRGQILTVTITYNYPMPVTFGVLPNQYSLTAQASMLSEI